MPIKFIGAGASCHLSYRYVTALTRLQAADQNLSHVETTRMQAAGPEYKPHALSRNLFGVKRCGLHSGQYGRYIIIASVPGDHNSNLIDRKVTEIETFDSVLCLNLFSVFCVRKFVK